MPGDKPNPVFRYFENLVDPFRDAPDVTPPGRVLRFYAYYLLQVWPIFAVPVSFTHLTLPTIYSV